MITAIGIACLRFFSEWLQCRFYPVSLRVLFFLFKAIAIAVYKTVMPTNGAIKGKSNCGNKNAAETSEL